MKTLIRTRIAPSPTGPCHLGTARTALFDYLFAKRNGGTFIFRLEDTDRERSTPEFEQELYDSLHWLGLDWNEGPDVGGPHGPYRQSECADRHRAAIEKLIETGHAYRCFCTAEELEAERKRQMANKELVHYAGTCRDLAPDVIRANIDAGKPFTVRFRMPDETFTFTDLIRGEVTVEGSEIGDFVIAKPNGDPIFHLSNVVDDLGMGITHIIRGEDHLSNTPKHIAIFRALGHELPVYAHLPLILNPNGSKMSKRKTIEGLEPYVRVFREKGYRPEALVNYLALLGWSPPEEDGEQLTLDQLVELFSLDRVNKAGARFDLKKLDDLNGCYIRAMSPEAFADELCRWLPGRAPEHVQRIAPLIQERLIRFADAAEYTRFFFEDVDYDVHMLKPKKRELSETQVPLKLVLDRMTTIEDFRASDLESDFRAIAESNQWKLGEFFMPIRIALSGSTATPPLFEMMEVLGRDACTQRVQTALDKLQHLDEPDSQSAS